MEEKGNFDKNSVIGFLLIGAILLTWLYFRPDEEPQVQPNEETKTEVTSEEKQPEKTQTDVSQQNEAQKLVDNGNDSLALNVAKQQFGAFGYSMVEAQKLDQKTTTFENEVVKITVANQGGEIVTAELKDFVTYNGEPVYLINNDNSEFNIQFQTNGNRTVNTKDLMFIPELKKDGDTQKLVMRAKTSESAYLEYAYTLKPDDYMLDFTLRSQGLNNVINADKANLTWDLKAYRRAKSISYENRYTETVFQYAGGKDDYTGQGDEATEENKDIEWFAFRQHFFTSILLTDKPFEKGKFTSHNLVQDEQIDSVYTKRFIAEIPIQLNNNEFAENMNLYFGPSDYQLLKTYDKNLDEIVPTGWGIFGWINKYVFIPFFGFLSSTLGNYGLAIIVMTIVVRIVLSPVTYKSYLSQAKMKVLRPEINELNEKYKDNAMKKQQETMKLYGKTGVSPLAGCIPALLQIPVFYALFQFFPSAFDLRQKSFLWADDLSSYDVIFEWDQNIPLVSWIYGNHVSLFPILASIAIFIYMTMTTGQNMQQSQQPGMPNMKFIMYLSPLFMLVFFNQYASGLSLYYFISNLITIGIMLVIKHVIVDEKKILAKIEQKKKKPKKKGKFSRKFQEIMQQAEEQQKQKKK
ncbi:MAG: membrane protein insertase YidC [Psychroflexus sp.]|nr:membrane protein insertase YidC [Psychroflexus sp.]MDN6310260.1 membrane protein insertase YidC [Psychroflexus sp.]